ncbi:MAG: 30S ribosomal protein S20 [Bacteroidota bacterium]
MANHKSAETRIRNSASKRLRNRYQAKSTRTSIKTLRAATDKSEAETLYKKVSSMLDKLAKKNIIHKKKAANQKSKLAKVVKKVGIEVVAKKAGKKTAKKVSK